MKTDHVKLGWPEKEPWTLECIQKKYDSYVLGYKIVMQSSPNPLQAYVIYEDDTPIGYIQSYDVRDFPREDGESIDDLPPACAAIDMYIGEPSYLGKGIGSKALDTFVKEYIFPHFNAAFVDPNTTNERVIRAYEKSGFHKASQSPKIVKMIRFKQEPA